jgi:thiol-disulfide isomerase/thioredoxin
MLNIKFLFLLLLSMASFSSYSKEISGTIDGVYFSYEKTPNKTKETFFPLDDFQDTEVLYFFNYNCFSCFLLQPYISSWENTLKKENVRFEKISVDVKETWEFTTTLHFLMKILKFKHFENEVFNEIHHKQRKFLSNKDVLYFLENKYNLDVRAIKLTNNMRRLKYILNKSSEIKNRLEIEETPVIVIQDNSFRYTIKIKDKIKPISYIVAIQQILHEKSRSPNNN